MRHADDHPDETAILSATESGPVEHVTFSELRILVNRLATAMRRCGVRKGDSVVAVVSNNQFAVAAMLATAAVGAIWSSCSPDYGPDAIVSRFSQISPRLMFFSARYRYKRKEHDITNNIIAALSKLHCLKTLVSLPVSEINQLCARHKMWQEFINITPSESLTYEPVSFSDPLYIMFSSGTTGAPKCIVQGPGVLLNTVKEHLLHFDITSTSCMLYVTSTSWMLFNWLVSALMVRSKIFLYDGAPFPPDEPVRLINLSEEHRVTHFGAGAQYFQTLSQHVETNGKLPIPSLTHLMGTGSPSTSFHFQFAWDYFGHVPYLSMSGGTEINGCFLLASPWKKVVSAELQCAALGMDVVIFDDQGQPVKNQTGQLVCRNACPCMPLHFFKDKGHRRYRGSYFEDFGDDVWSHGDFALETEAGGFIISGRSDSTLNPGGVRIGTSDIYEVVENMSEVTAALVTEHVQGANTKMVMFVVLRDCLRLNEALKNDICAHLRKNLSPRHVPHVLMQVSQIPYTFSGKKCEVPVKKLLMRQEVKNCGAVKNPTAFDEILTELQRAGLIKPQEKKEAPSKL